MMPPKVTRHIDTRRSSNVRIEPITIITLIVVISLAVMSVLALSTSRATVTISQRQADATTQMYLNEVAGQEFVAGVDDVLAEVRSSSGVAQSGARLVERSLDTLCRNAEAATENRVLSTASVEGTTVTAEFVCDDARTLSIALTIQDDASLQIDQWKMSSLQEESQAEGRLWTGA